MPPKANTLLSLPPDLVKRIVEQGGKNDLRRPLTTDVPRTGTHPDDPPMMYFQGLGWYEIPQRAVHTPAEQGRILDNAAAYINRTSKTPAKYNSAPTSTKINVDMNPTSDPNIVKPKPKARAKYVEDMPKPKPKPKAKVKAKAKAGY